MPIKPLDWGEWTGATVRIYRNLNNGTMSIQTQVNKSWKVVGHTTSAVVRDVAFKIQEGGRQRVIRDRRKNVHAWGQGTLVGQASDDYCPIALDYDPYANEMFLDRDSGKLIVQARCLVVRDNLVFVSPDAIGSPSESSNVLPLRGDRKSRIIQIVQSRSSGLLLHPVAA